MKYTSCTPDGCYLTILLTSKKEVNVDKIINIIINELGISEYTVSTKWTESNKKIFNFGKNRNFYSSIDFIISENFMFITDKDINNIKKKCKLSYVGIYAQPKYKETIHEIL
jgi:large-conductance mechanosensitive channel